MSLAGIWKKFKGNSHVLLDTEPSPLLALSDEQMQGGNLGRKDFWRKMFKSQSAASDTSSQSEQDTSECTTAHSGTTSDRRARSRSRRISLRKKLKLPIGKSMSVFILWFSYSLPCLQFNSQSKQSNTWKGRERENFQVTKHRQTPSFLHSFILFFSRYFSNLCYVLLWCADTVLGLQGLNGEQNYTVPDFADLKIY